MSELLSRVERRFTFSRKEMFYLFIISATSAFAITISKGWGLFDVTKSEGVFAYLSNLILMFIMIFIFLIMHFSIQKIMALKMGYDSEYKIWMNGLLISLMVCFLSWGYLPLFFTGALWMTAIPKLRVGTFRGGVMQKDLALIAFSGPFINLIAIGIIAPFYMVTGSSLLYSAIVINLLIAIYSLLPIPTFEKFRQFKGGTTGLYILIFSRWVYILVFAFVLIYAMLILIAHIFSYILAILLGGLATIIYYNTFEMSK
jgi:hypothetical protein